MQVKTMVINSSVSVTVMNVKQITRYRGDVYIIPLRNSELGGAVQCQGLSESIHQGVRRPPIAEQARAEEHSRLPHLEQTLS
jgi:hypothetical protein